MNQKESNNNKERQKKKEKKKGDMNKERIKPGEGKERKEQDFLFSTKANISSQLSLKVLSREQLSQADRRAPALCFNLSCFYI